MDMWGSGFLWGIFTGTGSPEIYLLYRALQNSENEEKSLIEKQKE